MKKLGFLVAVLALTLSGCAFLKNFFSKAFQQPTFEFKSVELADASLNSATLNLTYTLRNPNSVALSLAEVDYALFIEGKQVVAGRPPNGLSIGARRNTDITFPANVKFADIAPVVQTFLTKDVAAFRAQGNIGVQTPIGVLKFPLAKEGTFEVPKIPAVQLGTPRIANISFTGATVEFPLSVTSRNSYPLPIAGITGAMSIAGNNIGTLSTGSLGALAPRATQEVRVPITFNFASAAAAALALKQGKGNVALNGQVLSGGASLPLTLSQAVTFAR
jgi:LEA14-like dessication related protein